MKKTLVTFPKRLNKNFLMFAISNNILRFGKFKTKAGRSSPYFFDMGKFSNSKLLFFLGEYYSQALLNAEDNGMEKVDCLFGPAYKGIPLICSTAISLSNKNRLIDFAYNRKEEKKHGERGNIVGNVLGKNVLIIDDVISAGLSISKSIEIIKKEGGNPIGALVALDRMETMPTNQIKKSFCASKEITRRTGVPILAISNIKDLLTVLEEKKSSKKQSKLKMLQTYLDEWGGKN
ncbi:MAG: orotate phosphoribosyltransferase [Betaproteobacteria bacterium TMED41]|nr:MAG: orotate phosphoribosyltransferase [Betaproteobacteria bacterium TMED41]